MCVEVSRSTIRIISSDVRHRICAGQIVITLSGACKELIENALDANATVIEIRIKSFGVISLEVIDNGSGIHSFDFDSLCKPHATSKLSSLSDFNRLVTLGFRGEALNALCALSSVIIITRHALEKVGTKLVFEHNGCIRNKEICARSIGTTVIINNLFETLPVRRKELERSGKKEFTKLLYAIQSFALCRNDVRFLVNNDNNGKHFQILVTPGEKASITDVMISMFGVRVNKSSLLEIVRRVPDESIFSLYGVSEKQCHTIDIIKIHGFISSCMHGQGRSSTDRQFVYFNKRPVDYPKLCKIANEVYQTYNQGQYCIFILFIEVPPEYLDVNISPDKRSVFFEYEKELFALLRSSLLATFEPVLGCTQSLNDRSKNYQSENSNISTDYALHNISKESDYAGTTGQLDLSHRNFMKTSKNRGFKDKESSRPPAIRLESSEQQRSTKRVGNESLCDANNGPTIPKRFMAKQILENFSFHVIPHSLNKSMEIDPFEDNSSANEAENCKQEDNNSQSLAPSITQMTSKSDLINLPAALDIDSAVIFDEDDDENDLRKDDHLNMNSVLTCTNKGISDSSFDLNDDVRRYTRTQQSLKFSMSFLRKRLQKRKNEISMKEDYLDENKCTVNQKAAFCVDGSSDAKIVSHMSKNDFGLMEIIGQFNKGFIIVRLRDELFIVDQHASDEIYNFERFQKRAKIQTQRLISPQTLDIGSVRESVLRDNMEIFNYNGFNFSFNDKFPAGQRAMLISVPVLHNWQFNTSDIDEMLAVLSEFPGIMYRPVKLRRLFASRACRKSIMIGTALNTSQMEKIIRHLGRLDQPWNCPHGRPTLRHLCTIHYRSNSEVGSCSAPHEK